MSTKTPMDSNKIVSLLNDLDNLVNEHFRIIICGGAAAIIAHGLKRLTGDIDTFEPIPKSHSFYNKIKQIEETNGLDSAWFNESAKGFSDCLSLNYKNRLIPIDKGFKFLEVYAISKADLITMKLCAWRESDKEDILNLGITEEDMKIINENIAFMRTNRLVLAEKALRVLGELGLIKTEPLTADKVSNLAELIQFYKDQTDDDASVEKIRKWKDIVSDGLRFSHIARSIKGKDIEKGMDI